LYVPGHISIQYDQNPAARNGSGTEKEASSTAAAIAIGQHPAASNGARGEKEASSTAAAFASRASPSKSKPRPAKEAEGWDWGRGGVTEELGGLLMTLQRKREEREGEGVGGGGEGDGGAEEGTVGSRSGGKRAKVRERGGGGRRGSRWGGGKCCRVWIGGPCGIHTHTQTHA